MDANRRQWNQGHQRLHRALSAKDHERAINIFLTQHAMVHSRRMSEGDLWSLADEALDGSNKSFSEGNNISPDLLSRLGDGLLIPPGN